MYVQEGYRYQIGKQSIETKSNTILKLGVYYSEATLTTAAWGSSLSGWATQEGGGGLCLEHEHKNPIGSPFPKLLILSSPASQFKLSIPFNQGRISFSNVPNKQFSSLPTFFIYCSYGSIITPFPHFLLQHESISIEHSVLS